MCFSAEASFTVGSVITVIGVATFRQVHQSSRMMIALIPLLFGIQQLLEGVVWLHMNGEFISTPFSQLASNTYLFISWALWPTYIPLAFLISEKIPWKRVACLISFLLGIYITYVHILYLLTHDITPTIVGRSIFYDFSPVHGNIAYGLAVLPPIFISSIPRMWIFGVWLLVTFIAAQVIYATTFTSVWCFFCAAVSIVLFKILREAED